MTRIYHRFECWECYKYGLYDLPTDKELLKQKVVELFSDPIKTQEYMYLVTKKWKFSCEHNLTNISLNRIAWIGQAACCLYAKVPYRVTMEAWWLVPENYRNIADSIAKKTIDNYLNNLQLCLRFT